MGVNGHKPWRDRGLGLGTTGRLASLERMERDMENMWGSGTQVSTDGRWLSYEDDVLILPGGNPKDTLPSPVARPAAWGGPQVA